MDHGEEVNMVVFKSERIKGTCVQRVVYFLCVYSLKDNPAVIYLSRLPKLASFIVQVLQQEYKKLLYISKTRWQICGMIYRCSLFLTTREQYALKQSWRTQQQTPASFGDRGRASIVYVRGRATWEETLLLAIVWPIGKRRNSRPQRSTTSPRRYERVRRNSRLLVRDGKTKRYANRLLDYGQFVCSISLVRLISWPSWISVFLLWLSSSFLHGVDIMLNRLCSRGVSGKTILRYFTVRCSKVE
jgi:hypothetical protein